MVQKMADKSPTSKVWTTSDRGRENMQDLRLQIGHTSAKIFAEIAEKPTSSRNAQSVKNENKSSLKRKLFMCSNNIEDNSVKRHASITPPSTTPKRRRSLLAGEGSPTPGSTPKTPAGTATGGTGGGTGTGESNGGLCRLTVRQQVALLKQMTAEESQQGDSASPGPSSPPSALKRTPLDKKVNKRNDRGETPIHLAAIRGDGKLTKRLIKAGVDVNIKDYAGWTPLHEACNHGWLEIARQLLRAGANVNVQGYDNDTPLHDAAINGHHKLVQLLLRHGANPVQANSVGKSALDVATAADILRLLRSELIASSSGGSSAGGPDDAVRSPTSPEEEEEDGEDAAAGEDRVKDVRPHHGGGGAGVVVDGSRRDDDTSNSASKQLFPSAATNTDSSALYRRRAVPNDSVMDHDGADRAMEGTKARFARLMADKPYLRGLGEPLSDHVTVSTPGENCMKRSQLDSKWSPRLTLKFQHVKTQEDSRAADCQQVVPPVSGAETDKVYSVTLANSYDRGDGGGVNNMGASRVNGPTSSGVPPSQFEDISDEDDDEPPQHHHHHSSANSVFHFPTKTSPTPPVVAPPSSHHIPNNHHHPLHKVDGWLESNVVTVGHQVSALHRPPPKSPRSPKRSPSCVTTSSHETPKSEDSRKCVTTSSVVTTAVTSLPHVTTSVDDRPPSPKVPPLKIIMPSTSSCSSVKTSVKAVSTARHALPYVFNPSANDAECSNKIADNNNASRQTATPPTVLDTTAAESVPPPSGGRRNKHRGSNSSEKSEKSEKSSPLVVVVDKNTNSGDKTTAPTDKNVLDKNTDVIASEKDTSAGKDSEDASKTMTTETKMDEEDEGEKEEETSSTATTVTTSSSATSERRLTRAALRSQQLQQQKEHDPDTTGKDDNQMTDADSNTSNKSQQTTTRSDTMQHESLHRRRRLRHLAEQGRATPPPPLCSGMAPPAPVERLSNPYTKFLEIKRKMCAQWSQWDTIAPKPPPGYQNYLTVNAGYVLHGNSAANKLATVTSAPPGVSLTEPMRELYDEHEKTRCRLRLQHVTERERLVLCVEQEILRVHGRAARAIAQQPLPLSACTVLCHADRCKPLEFTAPPVVTATAVRSRYSGRQLISWQQDVTDKFEKIKEHMLLRQHNEAEALQAVQRLQWQWRLSSQSDRHVAPPVDETCVPLVTVPDDFDLLPTATCS